VTEEGDKIRMDFSGGELLGACAVSMVPLDDGSVEVTVYGDDSCKEFLATSDWHKKIKGTSFD
jgi:hypothetical protein